MLNLVRPDIKYKKHYIEMMEYWKSTGEELALWVLKEDYSDFEAMVKMFKNYSHGIDVGDNFVPNTTYWIFESNIDKIVGAVNVRHYLNAALLAYWGNIGYGIRPDERRKGYATETLRMALDRCRDINMEKVMLSCNKNNTGSAKVIVNNGGVLENEVELEGRILQRYWIKL
jgi:predicted acetyltransferase